MVRVVHAASRPYIESPAADDMFASDDEAPAKAPATQATPQGVDMARVPAPVMPTASAAVEYGSWPVKELRRFLQERDVDVSGIVEKEELVSKVKEVCSG